MSTAITMPRLLRSEWTKFRSLRSTWCSLVVGLLLAVGVGTVGAVNAAHHATGTVHAARVVHSSQFGVTFAQLAWLVLAAVFVTGECATGMIRSTMTVVPRRVPALVAKAGVLLAVLVPAMSVAALVAFVVSDVIWRADGHDGASLTDATVVQVLAGSVLYAALGAVFALAVGVLVRNTAAAVTVLVAVFFLLPSVAGGVAVLGTLAPYLPSNAGGALAGQTLTAHALPGWGGVALFAGYTAALCLAAAVRVRRTDV